MTYKPDVGDIRESAAIEVTARLHGRGADVAFHDPFVGRVRERDLELRRTELTEAALVNADCVALLTPHSSYDLDQIVANASVIFDARNVVVASVATAVRL